MENKRFYIYLPIWVGLAFAAGLMIARWLPGNPVVSSLSETGKSKLDVILSYIQEEYVDTVYNDSLIELAIPSLLTSLDPHSIYIPASEFSDVNEPLEGEFDGIGIEFNVQTDTIVVVTIIKGGPSDIHGLMPGDRIVKINDTIVAGVKITNHQVTRKLKGRKGSKVVLKVRRTGVKDLLTFELTRDRIPLHSIDISLLAEKGIGYIKISRFAKTTYEEFIEAVDKLHEQGAQTFILDLRGNGGGYMKGATNIADEFLDENQLIVFTQGRNRPKINTFATAEGRCQNDAVIILIDEWSASASEILAGAIQDNDRGIIIGRRSFGKGLVQEPLFFTDGSSLRLTVARYYTPTGRCIQKPYDQGLTDYLYEVVERDDKDTGNSVNGKDTLKYVTPGGKVLYGGGGISPDITLAADTAGYSDYLAEAVNKSLLYKFAFIYADEHRPELSAYKSHSQIVAALERKQVLTSFVEYAAKQGLTTNAGQIINSSEILKAHLYAYIARNIIGDKGFYPIVLGIDQTYRQAIKEAKRKKQLL